MKERDDLGGQGINGRRACGLDQTESGLVPVVESCEQDSKPLDFITGGNS